MDLLQSVLMSIASLYRFAMIIYILMSWFAGALDSSIGQFLSSIIEPYLEPFRKIIPPIGMIDISGLVALIVFQFAMQGIPVLLGFFR